MKTALITGGTKGIGYGVAEVLLAAGWKVAITGRNVVQVEESARKLNLINTGHAIGLVADVRDFKQQQDAVNKLLQTWGQLDVLVANAGLGHFGSIESISLEQ
jgi:NAD(P)-dependent dehydrogenase (short-subunit alcohol dehydrogenase family)